MEKIFSIDEASDLSRMSVAWWRTKILRKEIRYLKIGRRVLIPESTINGLFERSIVESITDQNVKMWKK